MNHRSLTFFKTYSRKFSTITIMRHAESVWNAGRRRVQGASENPGIILSDEGINSIKIHLKNTIKPDVLICSSLLRSQQTAATWFDCDYDAIPIKKKVVADLREIQAGIFEGRYIDELVDDELWKQWLKNPASFTGFPGGEAPAEFQQRVLFAFSQICSEYDKTSHNVCIITHGIVMRVLKCFLNDKNLSDLWTFDVGNLERLTLTRAQVDALVDYSKVKLDTYRRVAG